MKTIIRKFLLSVTGKLVLSLLLEDFKETLTKKVLKSDLPVNSQIIVIEFLRSINEEIITDLFNKHNIKE